jgi:hypothetical protein
MQTIKSVRVTDNQAEVYNVLREFGPLPDVALVPLAQHVMNSRQSSSGIRSRRAELEAAGLVRDTGQRMKLPSGRKAHVWAVR